MKFNKEITLEELNELLSYDESNGLIFWKTRKGKMASGSRAGTITPAGYTSITINGIHYLAHRLAWLITQKEWPSFIDHIDGNKQNNRIDNLREVTYSQNNQGQKLSKRSTTRLKGVSFHIATQKYQVRVYINGKRCHVGVFTTQQAAHQAYCDAAKESYGQFFNPGV